MNPEGILDNLELERHRRLQGLRKPDPHAFFLCRRAYDELNNGEDRTKFSTALNFAKTVKYHHPGLDTEVYFCHPLRVAGLALLLSGSKDVEVGVLGLLHNILEVSDVSLGELTSLFGVSIAGQIRTLTVNRKVQWDGAYKAEYYDRLNRGPVAARIVKILDKLDNLFVLGLNTDENVRENYLSEIKKFIVPMTVSSLPSITPYMMTLVENTYEIGCIGK